MKKEKYEIFRYLITGIITTILNITIFHALTNIVHIHYMISNILAWVVSVVFAYIANKLFVFKSLDNTKGKVIKEASAFFISRIASLGIDQLNIYIMIGVLSMDSTISKILSNIIVVIVNYLFSKFYVFTKN